MEKPCGEKQIRESISVLSLAHLLTIGLHILALLAVADAHPARQRFKLADIKDSLRPPAIRFIESLPQDFAYDWVEVPERRTRPNGKTLHIFYYWKPASLKATFPILFINGGPGFASAEYFPYMEEIRGRHNLVYMDQRGTGASTPLPEPTPENLTSYANYLSADIVADAEAVRRQLLGENSQWSVFGQSFGGMLAQRYIALAPRSLFSVHAHGWAPQSVPSRRALERLKAHDNILKLYFQEYPRDREVLETVWRQLPDDSCVSEGDVKICGRNILDPLGLVLGYRPAWPRLHEQLSELLDENSQLRTTALEALARSTLRYYGYGGPRDVLNVFYGRIEAYAPSTKSLSEFYETLLERLAKEGIDAEKWLLGEEFRAHLAIQGGLRSRFDSIPLEPNPLRPEHVVRGLALNPKLKFFLYSSSLDPYNPSILFADLVKACGRRVTYRAFEESGHEGWLTEERIWEDVREATRLPE